MSRKRTGRGMRSSACGAPPDAGWGRWRHRHGRGHARCSAPAARSPPNERARARVDLAAAVREAEPKAAAAALTVASSRASDVATKTRAMAVSVEARVATLRGTPRGWVRGDGDSSPTSCWPCPPGSASRDRRHRGPRRGGRVGQGSVRRGAPRCQSPSESQRVEGSRSAPDAGGGRPQAGLPRAPRGHSGAATGEWARCGALSGAGATKRAACRTVAARSGSSRAEPLLGIAKGGWARASRGPPGAVGVAWRADLAGWGRRAGLMVVVRRSGPAGACPPAAGRHVPARRAPPPP